MLVGLIAYIGWILEFFPGSLLATGDCLVLEDLFKLSSCCGNKT